LTDGSGLVHIDYDVFDTDGDTLTVSLQLSDDEGTTFHFPPLHVSGDVGPGIMPGVGKTIVWDAGALADPLVIETMQARVIASDAGVEFNAHSPRHVAITDGSFFDWSDPAIIEKFSRADFVIVMGHNLWMGGPSASVNAIQQMKALNPDLIIVGYVSVKSAQLSGLNQDPSSYWYKWYERTEPYFVQTTEGEIAQDWPASRLINILEPDCRTAMIETIMEMQNNSLNVFDGIMWDYFNNVLWVSSDVDNVGDPDMDGDGIGHWDDADEMAAYRVAQVDLVNATRDSLGSDFIQFFNGQRAYGDSTFAALGDGAFYELFPTLFFPDPDMGHALDPDYPFSLFNVRSWFRTENGGPFLVLSSIWYNVFLDNNHEVTQIITGDKFRAVSLLADTYSSWNSNPDGNQRPLYHWTSHDISLGLPLGPPVFEDPFIRREFQYGRVEIEMKSGAYPNPFDYRIWLLDELVSELAVPYHTP
ncbi:MAG: CHRD domain-containing protein, partial [Candidatus Krumholzibacteria bacterium]|nr:CHRD domain-containing protein [Candidatus Krumholzibacteria bacterium]